MLFETLVSAGMYAVVDKSRKQPDTKTGPKIGKQEKENEGKMVVGGRQTITVCSEIIFH